MAKAGDDELRGLLQRAQEALTLDASAASLKAIKSKLETLSTTLFLEWLLGDKRFESQSQQVEYWLSRLYDELFTDEQPDPTRIYERFGIGIARASYLARILRAQRTGVWRGQARLELRSQLQLKQADAEKAKKVGMGLVQEFDLGLSQGASDEMRVLFDRLSASPPQSERPRPPKVKPSFGNLRYWGVPAETLILLLEKMEEAQ